jgi:hypothetical protein
MSSRLGLWVYGVLGGDAAGPPACRGVDGEHPVELVREAGLAAVASRVPLDRFGPPALSRALEQLDTLEALARGHAHVLDETLVLGPVVPFGICTIFAHETGLRAMLARERVPLSAALRNLRGMAEWGVKGYLSEPPPAETTGPPASGVEYLARRGAARAGAATREAIVDAAHALLTRRASDAVLRPAQDRRLSAHTGQMALNAAYLVADAEADAFAATVSDLHERHRPDGLTLELTGPWPAYHFSERRAA